MGYCTQTDVERYLNYTFSQNPDPLITDLITRATAIIDQYCKRDFNQHTDQTEYYDGDGTYWIFLKHIPVISVSSVYIDDDLVDSDEYVVLTEQGAIRRKEKIWPIGVANIKVTYTYGYASVPDAIKDACTRLVVNMFLKTERWDELKGAQGISIAGINVNYGPEQPILTDEIKEILNFYKFRRRFRP